MQIGTLRSSIWREDIPWEDYIGRQPLAKVGFSGSCCAGSYTYAEIKERLDIFRKKKGANVTKTAMARWLLKVVYYVLKERRPYIAAYNKIYRSRAAFYFA